LLPQPASLEKKNNVVSNTFYRPRALKKLICQRAHAVMYNMMNNRKSDSDTNVVGFPIQKRIQQTTPRKAENILYSRNLAVITKIDGSMQRIFNVL
jgi:hypothetical protein